MFKDTHYGKSIIFQISLILHRADSSVLRSHVPQTVGQDEKIIQIAGQELNDESSESGDTTDGDSTADEVDWDSGEYRKQRVKKNDSHTHNSRHYSPSNAQHESSLEEIAHELSIISLSPKRDCDKIQKPNSTGIIKRPSKPFPPSTSDV